MKKIILIFLLLPIKLLAQDVTGVWTGTFYVDTTKKLVPYELAISEEKGRLSGFSHTTFIEEDGKKIAVKSINIKVKDDKYYVEDEEWIYKNYPEPAPKGVKQHSILTLSINDSEMVLSGPFNTNRTKVYLPNTGIIKLKKKKNPSQTNIVPQLSQLKLSGSLSFLAPKKDEDVAIVARVKTTTTVQQTASEIKIIPAAMITKEVVPDIKPPVKEEEQFNNPEKIKTSFAGMMNAKEKTISNAYRITKKPALIPQSQPQMAIVEQPKEIKKDPVTLSPRSIEKNITASAASSKPIPAIISPKIKEKDVAANTPVTKTITISQPKEKEKVIVKTEPAEIKKSITIPQPEAKKKEIVVAKTENKIIPAQVIPEKKEPIIIPVIKAPVNQPASSISASDLAKRKIETIKSVYFKSDSLTLTLYDNGEVDGDTVSILLNGKVIMPRVGLTTNAIKKTIYITPDLGDSLQLIMYAENLGSIPPNTGLLILQDGDDRYEIRFAGDMQKNSAIILKRKLLSK